MVDRLLGGCLAVLAGAIAIYVAVRLVKAVAPALIAIGGAMGALAILGSLATFIWRRQQFNRW